MDTLTIRLKTDAGTLEIVARPTDFADVRVWLRRFERGAAALLSPQQLEAPPATPRGACGAGTSADGD